LKAYATQGTATDCHEGTKARRVTTNGWLRRHGGTEGRPLVILRSHSEGLATLVILRSHSEGLATKDLRAYATEGTNCHEGTKTRRVDGFRRAHQIRWGAGEEN